jgi:hypothetical protein
MTFGWHLHDVIVIFLKHDNDVIVIVIFLKHDIDIIVIVIFLKHDKDVIVIVIFLKHDKDVIVAVIVTVRAVSLTSGKLWPEGRNGDSIVNSQIQELFPSVKRETQCGIKRGQV